MFENWIVWQTVSSTIMEAAVSYESILLVKQEVFVYKIPPRVSNRGYRAADWKLDSPDWTGRMRLVSKGKECILKLEDKISGELFAKSPIDTYPGIAIEAVMDSSRYFVVRIQDENGRAAFIGIGFADRGDSFDVNVALQDHFKWLQKSEEIEQETSISQPAQQPTLDLGFKDGETITINIGNKSRPSKPKTKSNPTTGTTGLLPPPPGGVKIPGPPSAKSSPPGAEASKKSDGPNLLGDLLDSWGDFASAPKQEAGEEASTTKQGDWVQF